MVAPRRSALALAVLVGGAVSVVAHVLYVIDAGASYLSHMTLPGFIVSAYLAFFLVGSAHGGFFSQWANHLSIFVFDFIAYTLLTYCVMKIAMRITRERSSQ